MRSPSRFLALPSGHYILTYTIENNQFNYNTHPVSGLRWSVLTSSIVPVSKNGAVNQNNGAYTLLYPDGKVLAYAPSKAAIYESIEDWRITMTFNAGAGYVK